MIQPMLASLMDAPLDDAQLVYEPKYDGIRAIVEIAGPEVRLWSRLGNEKTHQFPEIAAALQRWGRKHKQPVVLDGEIVALDGKGEPTGFQNLQGRIHLADGAGSALEHSSATALIAFDILRVGQRDLRDKPLLERRKVLENLFGSTGSPLLRVSRMVRGDGRALYQEALDRGWEGLIAKQAASPYKSGKRTPDWRKLKIVHEQEFVIGGWTEPRQTRTYFGALLLGVYRNDVLIYAGHTGTGFNQKELERVKARLAPLETRESPFTPKPKTNERPHWVKPEIVAQIKFTEWTADGKLRHPVYLGLRDDKKPADVHREGESRLHQGSTVRLKPESERAAQEVGSSEAVVNQLHAIESTRRDGILTLPDGTALNVTNLHKVFWPKQKLTKGDLLRYYAWAAPYLLPAVADRPLVMKRYPNGIDGKWFYQHRVDDAPAAVRRARVQVAESRDQIIGGTVVSLLYMAQLAAISQDPWFSRMQHLELADHAALDLDPSDGVPFSKVLDVARWIHDELQELGVVGVPKTSGASGLHIYVPLPPSTPYDAGLLFCQIVATVVAQKHPRVATIERSVRARGKRVYIDFMQNVLGKTLATAYSARASEYAGVSTPLTWREIDDGVSREDFTITTVPNRLSKVGDLWAELRQAKGIDLSRVTRYRRRS